jgi:hypothetical protein
VHRIWAGTELGDIAEQKSLVTVLDGPQYAVTSSHPRAIHSSRVELIFSVSTHVHLCSCPRVMSPDIRRRCLTSIFRAALPGGMNSALVDCEA